MHRRSDSRPARIFGRSLVRRVVLPQRLVAVTRTDDKCPECGGIGSIKYVSWYPGCSDIVTDADCAACLGTGKRQILEPSSAPPPNAAPHEHAEAEEAAYLEETSNG